jgi:hypothetical protein
VGRNVREAGNGLAPTRSCMICRAAIETNGHGMSVAKIAVPESTAILVNLTSEMASINAGPARATAVRPFEMIGESERSTVSRGFSPRALTTPQSTSPGFRFFHPIRRVTVLVRFLNWSVVKAKEMLRSITHTGGFGGVFEVVILPRKIAGGGTRTTLKRLGRSMHLRGLVTVNTMNNCESVVY